MQIRVFTIRMDTTYFLEDQNALNTFLTSVTFKKSTAHFASSDSSFWTVLVYFVPLGKDLVANQLVDLTERQNAIYNYLKEWRSNKAETLGKKKYMICHDSELIALAIAKPSNITELKQIKGFGDLKVKHFGDDIITLLNAF